MLSQTMEELVYTDYVLCIISHPEFKILAGGIGLVSVPRRRRRLNISVAIDPWLSKLKIWNLWGKKRNFFLPRPIRLIVDSFLFKTL